MDFFMPVYLLLTFLLCQIIIDGIKPVCNNGMVESIRRIVEFWLEPILSTKKQGTHRWIPCKIWYCKPMRGGYGKGFSPKRGHGTA